MATSVRVLGTRVDAYGRDEVIAELIARARRRERTRVMFVNAHCLNVARRDRSYQAALRDTELVLADGSGMLLAARVLGLPVLHNLNGTDLVPKLLEAASSEGLSVYFLGGLPGVAARAAEEACRRAPGLKIAGCSQGYLDPIAEARVLEQLDTVRPDILLVAMGVPHQELWVQRNWQALPSGLTLGVGALLDFMAGRFRRAPVWMRRLGIEWIYRLCLEPRRLWRRYIIGNALFLGTVLLTRLGGRAAL
jgi:N-acetylglucosaminyldiphosphoundecaprenol N-acetyl-beta-D-mannosaminyltransferase